MKKFVLSILLVILLTYSVQASIIGVSPSIIRFNRMIKGGYAENRVVVSTSFVQPIRAHFEPEGDIAEWMVLPEEEFVFSQGDPYVFTLIMQPPEDAQNGRYNGILKITTSELASVERGAGSAVIAQIALLIYVEVIGDEIIDCRAGAISLSSAEVGQPFTLRATVHNDGNVRIRPRFIVEVYDQYRTTEQFSTSLLGEEILPTKEKTMTMEVKNDLEVGQHLANIIVDQCGVSKQQYIDVLEEGAIADKGQLMAIRTNDVSYLGEPLPIFPLFKNIGKTNVIAQFKGEIKDMKTDKIVKILESDKLEVPKGDSLEFKMFWLPDKTGEYQISGRVVYNNKITFEEKSKIVTIKSKGARFKLSWAFVLIIYLIIGLIILILIGRIRKEKKRRSNHTGRRKIKW